MPPLQLRNVTQALLSILGTMILAALAHPATHLIIHAVKIEDKRAQKRLPQKGAIAALAKAKKLQTRKPIVLPMADPEPANPKALSPKAMSRRATHAAIERFIAACVVRGDELLASKTFHEQLKAWWQIHQRPSDVPSPALLGKHLGKHFEKDKARGNQCYRAKLKPLELVASVAQPATFPSIGVT